MNIHDLEREAREQYQLDYITTTSELESAIREIGVPLVNLSNTDLQMGIAIAEALGAIFKKYPALKHTICAIGDSEDMNIYYNMYVNESSQENKDSGRCNYIEAFPECNVLMSCRAIMENSKSVFWGFTLGKQYITAKYDKMMSSLRNDVETLYHPIHCSTIQSIIYHEVAHILDSILYIRTNPTLVYACRYKLQDVSSQISGYAASMETKEAQMSEIIAEAFAEYIMCPDTENELIRIIGEFIDKKYKANENSPIFRLNHRFGENVVTSRLK